jgi:hypothetical protein
MVECLEGEKQVGLRRSVFGVAYAVKEEVKMFLRVV